jgi:hypothetical protein
MTNLRFDLFKKVNAGTLISKQGSCIYFHVPGNYQVLEEILPRRRISRRRFYTQVLFFSSFFAVAVNFFFKVCCFQRNFDVEKVNAGTLGNAPIVLKKKSEKYIILLDLV